MKKSNRTLGIVRETLRHLTPDRLAAVHGGTEITAPAPLTTFPIPDPLTTLTRWQKQ